MYFPALPLHSYSRNLAYCAYILRDTTSYILGPKIIFVTGLVTWYCHSLTGLPRPAWVVLITFCKHEFWAQDCNKILLKHKILSLIRVVVSEPHLEWCRECSCRRLFIEVIIAIFSRCICIFDFIVYPAIFEPHPASTGYFWPYLSLFWRNLHPDLAI